MELGEAWRSRLQPRKWQSAALTAWIEDLRGIVAVVTGGGKTVFAESCIEAFRQVIADGPVVILVPTQALQDQWIVSLQDELGVGADEIESVGGGDPYTGKKAITVCILNSARKLRGKWKRESETLLIVDECHRAGSPENAKALQGTFAATLGLSATPEREHDDALQGVLIPALGPIIYEYDYREAFKDGVIVPFDLVNVEVQLLSDEQAEYDRLTKAIALSLRKKQPGSDEKIKRLLIKRASVSATATMRIPVTAKLVEKHRLERVVVFHERIDASEQIYAILIARGHRATLYHAGLGPAIRRDNLRMFRAGHFDVLVCCRALDEGMNVPEAGIAIVSSSTSSRRQRIQRLGRVLRKGKSKDTASIYTLYATNDERDRLSKEEEKLEGVASVSWARSARLSNV